MFPLQIAYVICQKELSEDNNAHQAATITK